MKLKFLFALVFAVISVKVKAAVVDTDKVAAQQLEISGSVDTYYKYDFAGGKISSIPTNFAVEQNSVSIGMIDLGLKKKVDKASFAGELSFGPRSDESIGGGTNANYHIQNLYIAYDLTEKLTLTAGYMSTFIGYEVNVPTGNFNYSTSYLFTNSAYEDAGLKATYTFNDRVSLMVGIFNDYPNLYQSVNDVSTLGVQLTVVPAKGWTAYFNLLTDYASGTEFDLTTNYQITNTFKLGLDASDYSATRYASTDSKGNFNGTGGFSGVALYPQYAFTPSVILGLRAEYFATKNGNYTNASMPAPGQHVTAFTLTANIKAGPLTVIPEIRLDNASNNLFLNSSRLGTTTASQMVIAAVYAF